MITFQVPGEAIGKQRPRATTIGGFARLYTPSKTVNYEGNVAWWAKQAMGERPLFEGPVAVTMEVWRAIPMSWSRKKHEDALSGRLMPTTKPDIDNVVKAVFDAINGVVWRDDVQVVQLRLTKAYARVPGVRVQVSEISPKVSTQSLDSIQQEALLA